MAYDDFTPIQTDDNNISVYDDDNTYSPSHNKYNTIRTPHNNNNKTMDIDGTINNNNTINKPIQRVPYIIRLIESIHPRAHYGYFVLPLASIINVMASTGTTFGIGFYSEDLMNELNITRSTVSLCWAVALVVTSLFIPFVGRSFDKIGATATAALSIPLYVIDLYLFSNVSNIYVMLLVFFLSRLIMSVWQLYSSYLVNQWFVEKKGLAMTLFQCMSTIGLCYPLLLSYLTERFGGWRQSLSALTIMYPICCSLLCTMAVNNPERVGRLPDLRRHVSHSILPQSDSDNDKHSDNTSLINGEEEIHWMWQDALKTRLFWTVTSSSVIVSVLWSGYNFHYSDMWRQQGVTQDTESLYALVTPANIVSMIFAGWFFHRLYNKSLGMCVGTIGCFISTIILHTSHTYRQAQIYAISFGMMDGIFITGYITIFAYSFGRANLGTIDAAASASITLACGLGPLGFGLVRDYTGSFNAMYYIVLCISVISTISLAFSKKPDPPPLHRRLTLNEENTNMLSL